MKLIPLSRGLFVQVDDEDFDFLNQWKWYAHKHKKHKDNLNYAIRNVPKTETTPRTAVKMHRVIMNVTDPKILVDHIDGNGLNCQKSNMRLCTNDQNIVNRRGIGSSKYLGVSLYKGVSKHKDGNHRYYTKRRALIRTEYKGNKNTSLGLYDTEEEAARAYDKAAKEKYGEFANLNFK